MWLFGAGVLLSFVGSLPPGLISLSVARTAVLRGFGAAMVVATGAAVAEFFQAWVAALCAGWLAAHPIIEQVLRWATAPVFAAVALYLWFWVKPPRSTAVVASEQLLRQFSQGVLVSAFNLLAVPYWVVYTTWLRANGWWHSGPKGYLLFALGVVAGTLLALGLYARLGDFLRARGDVAHRTINRTVAVLFGGLALWTLVGALIIK